MQRTVATVLVAPTALVREGLTRILGGANFQIIAAAPRVDEVVLTALARHRSVLLIIDCRNDLSAAIRQVALFKERHPDGRIAVLADRNEPSDIIAAFRAGANAYFIKLTPSDAFIKSLELVTLRETIVPAAMLSVVFDRADDRKHEAAVHDLRNVAEERPEAESSDAPRLSVKERCILNCLIEGNPNKLIARKIEITEATVKAHVKTILRKIHVHNRTQAAIWAVSNGLSISATGNRSAAAATVLPPLTPHLVQDLSAAQGNGSTLAGRY